MCSRADHPACMFLAYPLPVAHFTWTDVKTGIKVLTPLGVLPKMVGLVNHAVGPPSAQWLSRLT
jgi:hypothetical protein